MGSFAQIRHGMHANKAGYDDAVLVTSDGRICESTVANIGFLDRDTVVWPEAPVLSSPEFLDPLLDTLMRALPKTYESLHAEDGTTVVVVLNDGNRSLSWSLVTDVGRGWTVYPGMRSSIPTAQVILRADTFWILATGNVPRQQAVEQSRPRVTSASPVTYSKSFPSFDEEISAAAASL